MNSTHNTKLATAAATKKTQMGMHAHTCGNVDVTGRLCSKVCMREVNEYDFYILVAHDMRKRSESIRFESKSQIDHQVEQLEFLLVDFSFSFFDDSIACNPRTGFIVFCFVIAFRFPMSLSPIVLILFFHSLFFGRFEKSTTKCDVILFVRL